jgi:drug/metabolite transporter (DMT)-like permease
VNPYLALLLMVILNTVGQLLVKKGAHRLILHRGIPVFIKSGFNPYLIGGGLSVVAAPLLYMYALSKVELNAAYSFSGLTYLAVILSGHFILHEKITLYHIGGSLAILAGLAIWNIA